MDLTFGPCLCRFPTEFHPENREILLAPGQPLEQFPEILVVRIQEGGYTTLAYLDHYTIPLWESPLQ